LSTLLEDVIKNYNKNKIIEYAFLFSKSHKKNITKGSFTLQLKPENFSHLIGIQKLTDQKFTKLSAVLLKKFSTDITNNQIIQNNDYINITNSEFFCDIQSRLELIKDFDRLIRNKTNKLYEHNLNADKGFKTQIDYDYLIKFYDDNCPEKEHWYLFLKKDKNSSFILEPISIFKTDRKYHEKDYYWHIENLYDAKKVYEHKTIDLYCEFPEKYSYTIAENHIL
jgi:hypothetical protein